MITTRYILDRRYTLRGYKKLPYGIQDQLKGNTEFMTEPRFALLMNCDGQTDIDTDSLPKVASDIYRLWLDQGTIHECTGEERLLPYQEYKYYNVRFKQTAMWSVTGRCNYNCRHCFMSAPEALQGEPSFEQCIYILDALERCGIKEVHLTGGEPLVREDFWDIADEILKRNILIKTIYSNGKLIDEDFVRNLRARNIRPSVQFSFDGVGRHDLMRGVKGAEDDVIRAFELCRREGIVTTASMVLCKDNRDTIRDTVRLMGSLGCSYFKIGSAYEQGDWLNHLDRALTTKETYEIFMDYIPEYFEDNMPVSLGLEGFFNYEHPEDKASCSFERNIPDESLHKVKMCAHVKNSLYISPSGQILPCFSMIGQPIENRMPNMFDTPLEDILDESLYMDIINYSCKDYFDHNPGCNACNYKNWCCGGCRAVAIRTSGEDYLGKDLRTCEYFLGGWKEKKDELLRKIGADI